MARKKKIPSTHQLFTNTSEKAYHVPVLLSEAIEGLNIKPDGVYVDCTFGGGGHSNEILKRLDENGKLLAFDQDAEAQNNLPADQRITFIPHNFRHLQRFLRLHKISQVDGILADLGVSSFQFNTAERGFSTRFEGDLDMRMDRRQELTAEGILNTYSEQRLHKLFEQYGEISNAKTLAKAIVEIRNTTLLKSISNFKSAIQQIVRGNPNKYLAQVFQALRIEVNDELGALKEMLQQVPSVLSNEGRVAIITFHSLEDRIVKNFFKKGSFEENEISDLMGHHKSQAQLKLLTKKPIVPSEEEVRQNPRSRSGKLRIAEKI